MPISNYLYGLRQKVGNALILQPAVTMICHDDEGRVLLARHQDYDQWALPGGGIDPGETPADAAVRELWEETGLLVEPVHVQGVYGGPAFYSVYPNGDQIASVDTVFVCRVVGGQMAADQEEINELRYFTPAELAALSFAPWVQIVLADLAKGQAQGCFQAPTWQPPPDGVRKGGMSDYVRELRQQIGHDLLLLPGVGALVFDEQGRLLLQQRTDSQRWSVPVGGMDPYETPADAVLREIWEETGILAEPVRLFGIYGGPRSHTTHPNGDQTASTFTAFVCRALTNTPTPDGIESMATGFFPVAEAITMLPSHWRQRLAFALSSQDGVQFEPATWRP
ncbi:MAG: NUDIX domain-containing protein [Caldilinea sp. CFX5]|nr:NUDIX domain-containing protein [Caldilinea sp. CFX5]